jgi:FkbM family methyltransferase
VLRLRFTLGETFLIVLFVAIATVHLARAKKPPAPVWYVDPQWTRAFADRFGPEHFSAGLEEYIIRDFFNDRRDGVFLDVGAYHAKAGNNTYRLERDFGWSGLAIDANDVVAGEYVERPRTIFVVGFVGREDEGHATLHVPAHDSGTASGEKRFTEQFDTVDALRQVRRRTLNSLLDEHQIRRIDFLSMDIELSEPAALEGFDVERYQPNLVCIEAHDSTRDRILEYFTRHRYVLVGKYLTADQLNYWFRPLPQ